VDCLNDELLERYLLEPTETVRAHVTGCASCQGRVAEAEAVGRQFRAFVFPKTVDALLETAAPKRPWLSWWPAPLAALAAAMLAVVFIPQAPPDGYVGLKGEGAGVKLAVFTVGPDQAPMQLNDGAHLKPNAPLRFRLAPGGDCALWLVSVDARGEVSRIFPSAGAAPHFSQPLAVPGGAVLDGTPGPERIFAVCDGDTLTFDAIARSVKQLGTGAGAVRAGHKLDGLPPGTRQATLLLEKDP
jgi:hypothetical protein